jgi:hypothetical protein
MFDIVCASQLMQQQGVDPGSIRKIVDMGCATGEHQPAHHAGRGRPVDFLAVTVMTGWSTLPSLCDNCVSAALMLPHFAML